MTSSGTICLLVIAAWPISLCSPSSIEEIAASGSNYVQDACSVTRYHDICVRSLASYSNTAKRDPRKWARAGVSVTISEAKLVSPYLAKLLKRGKLKPSVLNVALSDCTELFQDTLDVLHKSLGVLRNFTSQNFESEMGDVISWLSAALTDQDTCLDGFSSNIQENMKQLRLLRNKVLNTTYMTSNALALVNKLATSGPQGSLEGLYH